MRQRLPDSAFADQKRRRYPIYDRPHVQAALVNLIMLNHMSKDGMFNDTEYVRQVSEVVVTKAQELGIEIPPQLRQYAKERVLFI